MSILASAAGRRLLRPLLSLGLAVVVAAPAGAVDWKVGDSYWSVSGYLRQYLSFNIEDGGAFPRGDYGGDLSMSRQQVRADVFASNLVQLPAGGVDLFMSVRLVNEQETDYQDALANSFFSSPAGRTAELNRFLAVPENAAGNAPLALRFGAFNALNGDGANVVPAVNAAAAAAGDPLTALGVTTGVFAPGSFHQVGDYTDYYRWYQFPVRELYLDIPITKRLKLRFGKQQVAWGDTDFFVASDLMHGFDFSWRSIWEGGELEELRKPLWLANFQLQVPEVNGSLQVVVRPPGLDRDEDVGNTFDIFGGRWANVENKGLDFVNFLNLNYEHDEGDVDSDVTGGVRWSARWRDFNYSLQYLHTFNQEPIVNPCTANVAGAPGVGCFWSNFGLAPFMREPLGGDQPTPGPVQARASCLPLGPVAGGPLPPGFCYLGDIIYPVVDTVGMNANVYVPFLDAVFATEVAYTFDKPFVTGSLRNPTCQFVFCGLAGVIEKDILRWSVRLDWQAQWTQRAPLGKIPLIGTHRPSFITVTLFDTWIPDFDKDDDIVFLVGNAMKQREHSTLATVIMSLPYFNDRMTVGLTGGFDLTYLGNGFFIPSVDFVYGNHWRLRLEADIAFSDGNRTGSEFNFPPNQVEPGSTRGQGNTTSLFGILEGSNQFLMKLSYLF